MMTAIRFPARMSIRACRKPVAACRPLLAAALPAALTLVMVTGITACYPHHHGRYPVQAAYTLPGPYATTTGTVKDPTGKAVYDLFYPRHYAALGFKSPIVTWGNGTTGRPAMVSTLLGPWLRTGSPSSPRPRAGRAAARRSTPPPTTW